MNPEVSGSSPGPVKFSLPFFFSNRMKKKDTEDVEYEGQVRSGQWSATGKPVDQYHLPRVELSATKPASPPAFMT